MAVLLIGPTGSGKTLLLKRLQVYKPGSNIFKEGHEYDPLELPPTIPTVGINLVNVAVGKRQEVVVREVGGTMTPLWADYYRECKVCLFVMDIANPVQVSAATVQFLDTLNAEEMRNKQVLLLLNKADAPYRMTPAEFRSIIPIDAILRHAPQEITEMEISASTGAGLDRVIKWIQKNA